MTSTRASRDGARVSPVDENAPSPPWQSLRFPRDSLGPRREFDEGGEGTLYQVRGVVGPFGLPLLYKEYKPGRLRDLDTQTLERFPLFARSLEANSLAWLYERASWPIWIVEDDQAEADRADVGVLMPLATDRFMADLRRPSGGRRRVPAKFELLLNGRRFLDNVGLAISLRQRLELLAAVADTMAFLHAHSIVVGDFSCTNLLFSLTPRPACFFLDCDSMSWGGRTALPAGETPEWELPGRGSTGDRQPATCTSSPFWSFACTPGPSITVMPPGCPLIPGPRFAPR